MDNYRVPEGDNIFDVALATYGTVENAIQLLIDNKIDGLDFDLKGKALTLKFDETLVFQKESPLVKQTKSKIITTHIVSDGQSLFDVALQVGYTLDSIIELARKNFISINDNLRSQQVLNFDTEKVLFVPFSNELRKTKYIINTSQPKTIAGASFDDSFDDSFDN